MKIDVLISCMHQKDLSIAERSHLTGSAVIINQCDENSYEERTYGIDTLRMLNTTERGLSKSRNRAIDESDADICLISDDDELYADNYEIILCNSYTNHPDADVILFKVGNSDKKYRDKEFLVGYVSAMKFASWNISFRRGSLLKAGIRFDENMGSGTGNGSGEEIKFLFDCLRSGLRVIYVPIEIAQLIKDSESKWFKGFTNQFFINRGWETARYMGRFWATLYAVYYVFRKYSLYRKDNTITSALINILKGIYCTNR